ncbi:L-xylulose reductase-like [Cylas formicarius]|uniref:L-xylulose reductase-like n=1 Tax=Cylas formicarius TaxID=197179 RepID=UPI002958DC6D|nr:L-xylulose reductase-like [Cylas formicarius]
MRIPSVQTMKVNLADWHETRKAVKSLLPVDMLVNSMHISEATPFTQITESTFDKVFGIDVKGIFGITQVIVDDLLKRNQSGSIVNISSNPHQSSDHVLQNLSKETVAAFTKELAEDVESRNIKVNSISSGGYVCNESHPQTECVDYVQRSVHPSDVVDVVIYLLSDRSKKINGHCVTVRG